MCYTIIAGLVILIIVIIIIVVTTKKWWSIFGMVSFWEDNDSLYCCLLIFL